MLVMLGAALACVPEARFPSLAASDALPRQNAAAEDAPGEDRWERAKAGYLFRFPADHASHPPYKIEWWYYTGQVAAGDGRRFGYQLTFFRVGLVFEPTTSSRWALRDLYMAHLATTDIGRSAFHFADRVNRGASWYAGAATDRYRVWNEDWEAWLDGSGRHRLRANDRQIGLDLTLEPGKPPVVHGENGISQKGARAGNATHYYSLTRMPTSGTITIGGTPVGVEGTSWMDHEFGTSVLEPEQIGWDWFSLQLDDGTDVMLFQLRRRDGSRDAHSSGTWVPPSGTPQPIRVSDFALEPRRFWRSPATAGEYPISWTVRIPERQLTLSLEPLVDHQELDVRASIGVAYWEGTVAASGTSGGRPVTGRGYVELTGYAGTGMGAMLSGGNGVE
jgi:predicted secreted hydrolase